MKYLYLFIIAIVITPVVQAQTFNGEEAEIQEILSNIKSFSNAYMNKDFEGIANAYTEDGSILPPGTDIISGRENIKKRWTVPENLEILHHEINPVEISIVGNTAYDMGYYKGSTRRDGGDVNEFSGKYIIIWKKTDGAWKIYWDIWNDRADN